MDRSCSLNWTKSSRSTYNNNNNHDHNFSGLSGLYEVLNRPSSYTVFFLPVSSLPVFLRTSLFALIDLRSSSFRMLDTNLDNSHPASWRPPHLPFVLRCCSFVADSVSFFCHGYPSPNFASFFPGEVVCYSDLSVETGSIFQFP